MILEKSDLIKEDRFSHVFYFWHWFYLRQYESFYTKWNWLKSSHGGAYKVYAWLVVFISKQCFISVWSCVFWTQQSPAPSGLIHHGPSPLLCPIRIRAAISVLYLWRDAPCIASCLLGQTPLNKERVCLRSLSDRKLRRSLKEVMWSNGNLLKRLSWPVGCCLDLLQSVNTLAAVLWSPARARHWMLLCERERKREGVQEDREGVN